MGFKQRTEKGFNQLKEWVKKLSKFLWKMVKNLFGWIFRKENILILIGLGIAVGALIVPFIIIDLTDTEYIKTAFTELASIGDFFGGTTVGLLSLSSIVFVTAAIVMQKDELKLQREELKKTNEEYKLTNATMRKQQFDSTFFNMINLHHNILKEISYPDYQNGTGRGVIDILFMKLKQVYDGEVLSRYRQNLQKEILLLPTAIRNDLLLQSSIFNGREAYLSKFTNDLYFEEYIQTKTRDVKLDIDNNWLQEKELIITECINDLKNEEGILKIVRNINIEGLIKAHASHSILDIYKENILVKPLKILKVQAYENLYNEHENKIGHYYRNLYRIIKLIQDEEFDVNDENNEKEKRKYRGILRAQLSSTELMMLFYNVTYSQKGEKFKSYIINTNFFDDHLIQSDFIWANDNDELELIN